MTTITINGYFNRTITNSEIDEILAARSLRDIESLWGQIADWFCGTKKEEAKKYLFELTHETSDEPWGILTKNEKIELDHQRFKIFNRLKECASPTQRHLFVAEQCDINTVIRIEGTEFKRVLHLQWTDLPRS